MSDESFLEPPTSEQDNRHGALYFYVKEKFSNLTFFVSIRERGEAGYENLKNFVSFNPTDCRVFTCQGAGLLSADLLHNCLPLTFFRISFAAGAAALSLYYKKYWREVHRI